jgi:hypothetical protein
MTGIKVSEKSSNDDSNAPQLNLNDLASIEDDLKSEYDIMNNLIKSFETMKIHCEAKNVENRELVKTMEKLKVDLSGELLRINKSLCNKLLKLFPPTKHK